MEGSTELSKFCKVSFVAERPRRTGLSSIFTGILSSLIPIRGTVVAQRLRRCDTNRKVADSIPDGVFRIFH